MGPAPAADTVGLFFLSLRLPPGGTTLGSVDSVGTTPWRATMTDVSLADPWAYGSALLLFLCAAGATLIPTLRAARAEPWQVLRND